MHVEFIGYTGSPESKVKKVNWGVTRISIVDALRLQPSVYTSVSFFLNIK